MIDTGAVREYLLGLQGRIVQAMQAEDASKTFITDSWTRPAGGKLEGDGLSQLVEDAFVGEVAWRMKVAHFDKGEPLGISGSIGDSHFEY